MNIESEDLAKIMYIEYGYALTEENITGFLNNHFKEESPEYKNQAASSIKEYIDNNADAVAELNKGIPETIDKKINRISKAAIGEHIVVGDITPDNIVDAMKVLNTQSNFTHKPIMVLHYHNFQRLINHKSFEAWLDPSSRYEALHTGNLGVAIGITFITDGFAQRQHRVLEKNISTMYIVPNDFVL